MDEENGIQITLTVGTHSIWFMREADKQLEPHPRKAGALLLCQLSNVFIPAPQVTARTELQQAGGLGRAGGWVLGWRLGVSFGFPRIGYQFGAEACPEMGKCMLDGFFVAGNYEHHTWQRPVGTPSILEVPLF